MVQSIGIRELRQAASEHLRAVSGGEQFIITERGRPVARLVPASILDQKEAELLRDQRLIPASRPRRRFSDTRRLTGNGLSDLVEQDRDDRVVYGG